MFNPQFILLVEHDFHLFIFELVNVDEEPSKEGPDAHV